MLIINFKTYKQSTGKQALELAKKIELASKEKDVFVAIAAQAVDLKELVRNVSLPLLAQHVDFEDFGGHTGSVNIGSVKQAGALGTLLNHSEKKLGFDVLKKTLQKCKKEDLLTVVCAENVEEAKKIAELKPDFIAVEPPELIGGDISVVDADPNIIKKSVKEIKKIGEIPVLCGAGVKTSHDVSASLKLGAKGVLVASGVVKNEDPFKETLDLLRGF